MEQSVSVSHTSGKLPWLCVFLLHSLMECTFDISEMAFNNCHQVADGTGVLDLEVSVMNILAEISIGFLETGLRKCVH